MSFKLHLMIVSFIIVTVYLVWLVMNPNQPAVTTALPANSGSKIEPYKIAIIHASWGLNCPNVTVGGNVPEPDPYANPGKKSRAGTSKLREDNVFVPVSLACNGKDKCSIDVADPVLGDDPAPECTNKALEVQYRCYSYDRPWTVKATSGAITIDCSPPAK